MITLSTNIPSKLLVEDYVLNGDDLTIYYAWEYVNGSQDEYVSEYHTSLSAIEDVYSQYFDESCSLAEYWELASYTDKLALIRLFFLNPKNGIALKLGVSKISQIISLTSKQAS